MSENEKLVPKRRFKAFENDVAWEQRELREVVNLENGYAFKSDYFVEEETGIEVLTPGNVNIGGGFQADKGRNYSVKGPAPEKFVFKPNDVFVTMTDLTPSAQTLGYPALVPDDGKTYLHNQRLGKLTNFKGSSDFLIYLLCTDTYHNEIISSASGTTVKHSSPSKILKYSFMMPEYKEQELIGKFFRNLDQTIAFQQRKLEKVKSMKSAYLSEMFPAEGERKPKRRFPGFTDDWEQRELREVADIIGGGTPSTSVKEFWDGSIDWYSPVEIGDKVFVNGSQKKITDLGFQKSSAQMLPAGTVLFTSRAGIGNTAILEKEACTNQGFQSIVPKENLDTYFIYSRSHELKRYGEITGAGSTFVEVSGKQMAKMPILIPDIKEQKEIGNFFKNLDQTIAFQQQKLEKLQNIKKAYLNEMFI